MRELALNKSIISVNYIERGDETIISASVMAEALICLPAHPKDKTFLKSYEPHVKSILMKYVYGDILEELKLINQLARAVSSRVKSPDGDELAERVSLLKNVVSKTIKEDI